MSQKKLRRFEEQISTHIKSAYNLARWLTRSRKYAVQTQKNIAEMLPNWPEYVVTTSESNEVRERLKVRYVPRPQDDPNRPRLRKAPAAVAPGEDSDEKPTLNAGTWSIRGMGLVSVSFWLFENSGDILRAGGLTNMGRYS